MHGLFLSYHFSSEYIIVLPPEHLYLVGPGQRGRIRALNELREMSLVEVDHLTRLDLSYHPLVGVEEEEEGDQVLLPRGHPHALQLVGELHHAACHALGVVEYPCMNSEFLLTENRK